MTPWGGLLALLALVPLAAWAVAERRIRRARAVLALTAPAALRGRVALVALACVPLLLGLAAMQPALRTRHAVTIRADAGVFVVVDTSSSMSARASATAPTRLAQARRVAVAADAGLTGIPTGIATFTDRVLPNLFPSVDGAAFASTAAALTVNSPPPRETQRIATTLGVLASVRRSGFFTRAQTHRALLLVTDGESRPYDSAALAHALAVRPAVHVFVVRVAAAATALYTATGRPGGSFRANPERARRAIEQLTAATGGREYATGAAASAAIRATLGSGPTTARRATDIETEPCIRGDTG